MQLNNEYGLTLNSHIPSGVHNKEGRPTVVMALHNRGRILMVRPTESVSWCLPQGGIEGETILRAFRRECLEELGRPGGALSEIRLLGCGSNPLPPERHALHDKKKYLVFVSARLSQPESIRLNGENSAYELVAHQSRFLELFGVAKVQRPEKFTLTQAALMKLQKTDLLPDWYCPAAETVDG